jgi:hypothetical protein
MKYLEKYLKENLLMEKIICTFIGGFFSFYKCGIFDKKRKNRDLISIEDKTFRWLTTKFFINSSIWRYNWTLIFIIRTYTFKWITTRRWIGIFTSHVLSDFENEMNIKFTFDFFSFSSSYHSSTCIDKFFHPWINQTIS